MPELRTTNYYADQVAARYPLLDPKAVRRVCRYLMRELGLLAVDGEDVLLQSAHYAVKLKVFTPDFDTVRHNKENYERRFQRARMRAKRLAFFVSGTRTNQSQFPLKKIR